MAVSLNEAKLRLTPNLERAQLPDGTELLKQTVRAEYLAITPVGRRILDRFDGTRTVQEVLHDLLMDPERPPLRAFHDLVTAATDKGLLEPEGAVAPAHVPTPWRWPLGWGYWPAVGSSLLLLLGAVAVLVHTSVTVPPDPWFWLFALVCAAVALSLGHVLAGCALRGGGRQVYGLRVNWRQVLPHLAVDHRDAFMGGRRCETAVALQTLSGPFLMIVAALPCDAGVMAVGGCLAAFMLSYPFGDTPAQRLLTALFRRQYQAAAAGQQFLAKRLLRFIWQRQLEEETYLAAYGAYLFFWLGLVVLVITSFVARQGDILIDSLLMGEAMRERLLAGVVLGALAAALLLPFGYQLFLLLENAYHLVAPRLFAAEKALRRGRATDKPPAKEVADFLATNLLFSQLPREQLPAVAAAMDYRVVPPRTTLIREGDRGDSLFVLYFGAVEVLKEDDTGVNRPVARLGPGDVFGEIALILDTPRTSSVVSAEKSGVLMLDKAAVQQLLLGALDSRRILDIVQISCFLRRVTLFADWPNKALLRITGSFDGRDVEKGQVMIRQGEANQYFYLIYEGEFEVVKDGAACALLGPGSFFGEISLLRNVPATATVTATRKSRVLALANDQFREFVSRDLVTACAIDTIVEAREQHLRQLEGKR